jgi:large subunit ribosomal protein L22
MQYLSIQKNINSSPRKLRLVADMVRKMRPEDAVETLKFTNQAAATPLAKAIKTAVANASGATNLSFKSIEVNEGMKMRRYRVGTAGRGRGRPYKKRFSHIKVVLTDEIIEELKVKVQKTRKEQKGVAKTQPLKEELAVEAATSENIELETTK